MRQPARIMLGVGFVATAIVVALAIVAVQNSPFIDPRPTFFGLSPDAPYAVGAVALALFGLARMVRIYRGMREDRPPAWRYRDR